MILNFSNFEKLNEELFSSEDSEIVDLIIGELKRHFEPSRLSINKIDYGDNKRTVYTYLLVKTKRKVTPDDPYGEESYGENKNFSINMISYYGKFKISLSINGIEMNVSYFQKSELENIFDNYEKRLKKEANRERRRRDIENKKNEIARLKKQKEDLKKSLLDFE